MNQVRKAVKNILSDDPIIEALVGRDSKNQPKVYEFPARKDVVAPMLVWQLLPSEGPEGLYHDLRAMEIIRFQVSGWGTNQDEAWGLFEAAQTALETGEWGIDLLPYSFMSIVRTGDQVPLVDVETGWFQVPCTYRLKISR